MQSFGFTKKAPKAVKVAVQHDEAKEENVEYLTGVNDHGLEVANEKKVEESVKVIPSISNTFEVGTGRKRKVRDACETQAATEAPLKQTHTDDDFHARTQAPSFLPTKEEIEQDEKRFHVAETIASGTGEVAQHGVSYGLTKMGPQGGDATLRKTTEDRSHESFIGKSLQEKELQAFKEDMEDLPDQASMDEYESMPIEDFGKAMLRGMGWEEGKAVGRMHKGMVEAVEFIPRAGRLGLGAQPSVKEEHQKKYIKPGETREKKPDLVRDPQIAAGAGLKNVKTLDEKLVKREELGPREGKRMYIADGRHSGMSGRVVKITDDKVSIELTNSGKVVTVRTSEIAEMSAATTAKVGEKRDRLDKGKSSTAPAIKPWLLSNIRVRIVSKSFKGGQYYLTKGVIVDVLTPTDCLLQLEGSAMASTIEVPQRALETVLPKTGGRVCIVSGTLRGRRGKLLEKIKSNGTASIQLNDDFSAHVLPFDAIAEYAGALDDDD